MASQSAAAEFARRQQSPLPSIQPVLHGYPWVRRLFILVVAFIAFTLLNSRFASASSLGLLLQQTAVIAVLAIRQTVTVLHAGSDLSVGAIASLSMMVMATLAKDNGLNAVLALLAGLALAVAAGLLNGLLVTRLNLPPFIVTLGTLSIFTALALLYSGGSSIQADHL